MPRLPSTLLFLCCACRAPLAPAPLAETPRGEPERAAVERVLDDWGRAATEADGARYFGHMEDGAIFLGTDASERWTLAEFRAFCEPYFAAGRGWTYTPRERHVFVNGDLAWFDELLWNEQYGDCRGTGALRRVDGEWKIAHYSLSLLIPNERAAAVVELVRAADRAD